MCDMSSPILSPQDTQTHSVSYDALHTRICVRPPYYALHHERLVDDVFVAEATAELPQGRALGPMRPGDLSRHGAIAGLCAAALQQRDDKRRFYLANQATFQGFPVHAPYGVPIQFEARVTALEKRSATASVRASVEGVSLATLEVHYSILTPALFERLNAHRRQATPRLDKLAPVAEHPIHWDGGLGTRVIPAIPLNACSGHFDDYPAAPVALLMDQLAQVAEQAVPEPSYIARGEVTASRLCWAGEEAVFTMRKLEEGMAETQFEGDIRSQDADVGTMRLWLRYSPS